MPTITLPIRPPAPSMVAKLEEPELASKDVSPTSTKLETAAAAAPAADAVAADLEAAGNGVNIAAETDAAPKRKGKKKKGGNGPAPATAKSGTTGKSKTKPSGFEEYVVDGPLTKAEADIEEALYALSKPFAQRMETCIQRYKARRKFDAFRINIFNSYLRLGGVQTGQKQYSGGIDPKKMDDLDAEQIGLLAATDFITFNDNGGDDAQEYDVDFAFVVRGFLSYKVPYGLGIRKVPELEMACQVVRNFLNYVIYHNVCPEYIDNIKEAIELCNLAEKELVLCIHVSNLLPGSWNMACSTIYGGSYAGIFDPEATWDDTDRSLMAGLDPKMAKELILVGLNRRGTPEQIARGLDRKLTEFKHFLSLEVLEVVMPGPSPPLPENADMALPDNKYFRNTQALGYLKVTPWVAEEPFKEDQLNVEDRLRGLEIIIWLEKICLQYCFPGMHVEAKVHQFDDGLIFIDSVTGVLCSFFMRLEYPKEDKDKDGDFSD